MISGFKVLSEAQFEITKDAIVWITTLIAGADGHIDSKETEWAEKITKIRSYHNPNELTPFYEEVGKDFQDRLISFLERCPKDLKERNAILERKLSQLNDILPLLSENNLGFLLYESYKSFADHVAKAAGGFLGFFSVGSAESKYVNLPMINEIIWQEAQEEE